MQDGPVLKAVVTSNDGRKFEVEQPIDGLTQLVLEDYEKMLDKSYQFVLTNPDEAEAFANMALSAVKAANLTHKEKAILTSVGASMLVLSKTLKGEE